MDSETRTEKRSKRRVIVLVPVLGIWLLTISAVIISTSSSAPPVGVIYFNARNGQRPRLLLTNRTDTDVFMTYSFQYKITTEWMGWAGSHSDRFLGGTLVTLQPHTTQEIQSFAINSEDSWRLQMSIRRTLPGGFWSIGPRLSAYYWMWHGWKTNGANTSQLPGPFSPHLMSPPTEYFVPLITTTETSPADKLSK